MDAKQCDRCKNFYLETGDIQTRPADVGLKIFSVTLKGSGGTHIRSYDLCAACALKLDSFLKERDDK